MSNIDEIFSRGIGEFIDPDGIFKKKLIAKSEGKYDKDIIVKYGVDPTRPDIHLGHAVCFKKLRQLQDLGCKIVFLVGDYTARIGDPTGKNKVRPELEQRQVEENLKTYVDQIDKIIDVEKDEIGGIKIDSKKFSWIRNSDWFASPLDLNLPEDMVVEINGKKVLPNSLAGKSAVFEGTRMHRRINAEGGIWNISLMSILWSLKHITYAQLIKRDMFQDRIKKNEDLFMHEMLYPVFQGIDSYAINRIYGSCDLEVGGTDQTFNMLMGRDAQKINKEFFEKKGCSTDLQAIMSLNLLEGTDGSEKMSKSMDNYIGITEEPNSIFGKIMSIPDSSMINYYELCTELPLEEIRKKIGNNPRDAKIELAREVVKIYHGEEAAEKAKEYFVKTISNKEMPEDVAEVFVEKNEIKLVEFLVLAGLAKSNGEARRKIEQGGLEINGVRESDWQKVLTKSDSGAIFKVGKFGFAKLKL